MLQVNSIPMADSTYGEFGATFVSVPHDRRAVRAGARVIQVRPMLMIRGVTLTTTLSFVKEHKERSWCLCTSTSGG